MTVSSTSGDPVGAALVDDTRRELRRCLDRVAALGPVRLVRSGPRAVGAEATGGDDPVTPADVLRPVLQQLADVAADLEDEPRRVVPPLGAHALGDQLAVLAHDVLCAAATRDDDGPVVRLNECLVALRRAL